MQLLKNIKTDITPFNKEARMVQDIIHLLMKCGVQHPLAMQLELLRSAGVLMSDKELKDMIFSMERQGMIKFPKPEAKPPENGIPESKTVPINNSNGQVIE